MQSLDKLISELKKAKESLKIDKKEPHKDDPKHEQKEQEKAKKIKKEAQSLLDLHKEEMDKGDPPLAPSKVSAFMSGVAAPAAPATPNTSKADDMDKAESQEVFDELVKNGHTESALLLKNWGEEDALAKSYREYLTKSKKPDSVGTASYSDKEIKAARSAVDAAGTEDNHVKLFNNANSHYGTHASDGDHAGGSNDMVHDNYQQSLAHYHKTGKALKFGKDTGEATGATIRAGVKSQPGHIPLKEVRVPKISGPKGKLL